jgi:hypothetical protein
MLSIHLLLGLPSGLFPSGFPTSTTTTTNTTTNQNNNKYIVLTSKLKFKNKPLNYRHPSIHKSWQ